MTKIFTPKPFYPIVLARRAAQFNLINNTWIKIAWDIEDLDIFNAWDGIKLIAPRSGSYRFSCSLRITGSGTTGAVDTQAGFYLNNVLYGSYRLVFASAVGTSFISFMSPNMVLAQNDTFEIGVLGSFTGATSVYLNAGIQNQLCIEYSG